MAKKKKKVRKARVILFSVLMLLIVALVATVVVLAVGMNKKSETASETETESETLIALGYEGGVVAADQDSLNQQVAEMYSLAAEGYASLEYKNDMYSTDGKNFTCYVANSKTNKYDMYIALYEGDDLTKQIYLSGLVPTNTAIERFTSDYTLPAGTYDCTLILTQVESDHATMHAQVSYTVTLHVG